MWRKIKLPLNIRRSSPFYTTSSDERPRDRQSRFCYWHPNGSNRMVSPNVPEKRPDDRNPRDEPEADQGKELPARRLVVEVPSCELLLMRSCQIGKEHDPQKPCAESPKQQPGVKLRASRRAPAGKVQVLVVHHHHGPQDRQNRRDNTDLEHINLLATFVAYLSLKFWIKKRSLFVFQSTHMHRIWIE